MVGAHHLLDTNNGWIPWSQAVLIALTALTLVLLVGGVYPVPRAVAALLVALALMLEIVPKVLRGASVELWERTWLFVWLAVTAMVIVQLIPLPPVLLSYLGAYPESVLQSPGLEYLSRISPHPAATVSYWAMFTTYWAAAYLVARLPRIQLKFLLLVVLGLVLFEAIYGLVAHLGRHETVLGLWPARDRHFLVLGTYYNRNHIAGLFALGWPLGVAFLLYGTRRSRHLRAVEVHFFWLVMFCAALALALFNTQSRLGSFAAMFGLVSFVLALRYDRQHDHKSSMLQRMWLIFAGLLALFFAIWFGLGPLLGRYADLIEGADVNRLRVWQVVFDLPAKVWLFGIGAGGFEEVFKLVQPAELRASYLHLHNDWLQFVLEFGVLGTGLLLVALRFWWLQVKPERLSGLQAGALGGIAAIALHSLGDFNLQVPGTAFVFWLTVGVFCNRHLRSRSKAKVRSEE